MMANVNPYFTAERCDWSGFSVGDTQYIVIPWTASVVYANDGGGWHSLASALSSPNMFECKLPKHLEAAVQTWHKSDFSRTMRLLDYLITMFPDD